MLSSPLSVQPVRTRRDLREWLSVPHRLFADDPKWVAPLDMVERKRVTARGNPFFKDADVELFIARRGTEPVGRVSAQVSRLYLAQHQDATGHFGFLDTINDQDVATSLLDATAHYVGARGMKRLAGPYNLSINEECGILIDGFDRPPTAMMPQSARWQAALVEAAGFSKEMDLYAYRMTPDVHPDMADWFGAFSDPAITVRRFERKHLDDELARAVDIFNDAWSENWGFVPFTIEHMLYLFRDFRMFFRSRYGKFIYVDGELAAFAIGLPNISEIITGYDGKLLPLNWVRMLYAMTTERFRTARLPLFGIKKKFQRSPRAAAIFAAFMKMTIEDVRRYDLDWMELSWVLQSNRAMTTFLERKLGPPAQTYRLYSKSIG